MCASKTVAGTVLPTTDAGSTATGSCAPGYQLNATAPTLSCDINGAWDASISDPCLRTPACPSPVQEHKAGLNFNTLLCHRSFPFCFAEIYCQDTTADSGSSWQAAPAGDPATIVSGTCDDGYYVADGAPYRGCDIDGNWQTIQNPCQRTPIDSSVRETTAGFG